MTTPDPAGYLDVDRAPTGSDGEAGRLDDLLHGLAARGDTLRQTMSGTVERASMTAERLASGVGNGLRGSSDSTLLAGTSLAAGLGLGLLVAGAPRLLAAAVLVPAAVLAGTLVDRRSGPAAPPAGR